MLTPDLLHERLRAQRDLFNEEHSTRLHRAISWWRVAQQQSDDPDMCFISAWISLMACSVSAETAGDDDALPLLRRLVELDQSERIYDLLWHTYSGPVRALIKNPYVYAPFWAAQRGECDDWRLLFERSSVEALNCLSRRKVAELLAITLERLSVLRAQVLGGGATYGSSVNREQVTVGGALLLSLLPVVLDIMLNHPHEPWGPLAYPVVGTVLPA